VRYLSLFSGIEAASVAWRAFGTPVAFSEIEPFPCAELAHHYPEVPNLGDVTKITEQQVKDLGPIDVVVFGSPCTDLSVAGKRAGFIDEEGNVTRSGLFFNAINIIGWARKHCGLRFALWENVPGAFSSNKGADFAEVVKHMAGLDELDTPTNGWGTEGCALGTQLVEWAVLDAQWFGVAQRRKRVFALADFGDWAGRPPILLEPESLRGNTPPSRETGQGITHPTAPCLTSSGGGVERTGDTRGQDHVVAVAYGGGNTSGSINVATACNTKDRCDFETETLVAYGVGENPEVGHCLRSGASKADKHESTTYVLQEKPISFHVDAQPDEMNFSAETTAALTCSQHAGVCETPPSIPLKAPIRLPLYGINPKTEALKYNLPEDFYEEVSYHGSGKFYGVANKYRTPKFSTAEKRMFHSKLIQDKDSTKHWHVLAQGEVPIIVSNARLTRKVQPIAWSEELTPSIDVAGTIQYGGQGGRHDGVMTSTAQVRRLTPVECARLQGFPDTYLDIQFRNKPAADGNKYKALGNSMAVPVMRYIGLKINSVLTYDWVEDLF
jgi:site-specific DNA-cytosine methylase